MERSRQRGEDWLRDYVDDVEIRVETVEGPESVPVEVLELRFPGDSAPSQEAMLHEIEGLIAAPDAPLLGHAYQLQLRRNVVSWGADGAAETILLQVAEWAAGGAAAGAGWAAVRATLTRIAGLVQRSSDAEPAEPLGRDEALARAEWAVRERFGLPPSSEWLPDGTEITDHSLVLVREEHAEDGFEFAWDRENVRYEARVSQDDNYVSLVWIRRTSADGPS